MTDPLCRKNWNVYEHYLYLNPNADLKIIKEEAEFFQDLREQISKLTFGESSLHTEDCPDFERQTYFAISKWNLLSGVLNLCELGSYIAADPSSTVKYTPEKYNETLDGFITEAKTIREEVYLKIPEIDLAISHLEELITAEKN